MRQIVIEDSKGISRSGMLFNSEKEVTAYMTRQDLKTVTVMMHLATGAFAVITILHATILKKLL